jgi:hypothetical protein
MEDTIKVDYVLAKELADACVSMDKAGIEAHIRFGVGKFAAGLDESKMDDRKAIYDFISCLSALLLNFCLNSGMYMLSEDRVDSVRFAREVVAKVVQEYRERF